MKLSDIVARTQTVWGVRTVNYSMNHSNTPTRHRADCSGYVSAVLGLPTPGQSTVTLVTSGNIYRIDWSDLQPGDLLGIAGPGTAGAAGHIAVYVGREGSGYVVWEQSGGQWGPHRSVWSQAKTQTYRPYRYKGVDLKMALGDRMLSKGMTGSDVKELQQLLLKLSYNLGSWRDDGDFGDLTDAAVRAFQRSRNLEVDGVVGPITLKALREATAPKPPTPPAPPVVPKEPEPDIVVTKLEVIIAKLDDLLARPVATAHVDVPSLASAIANELDSDELQSADIEQAVRNVLRSV